MTEKAREKREKLKAISKKAKEIHELILKEGVITVNDMIMTYIYNEKGKLTFKSFKGWKKEGFSVKKGEKAFLLWGQPLGIEKQEEGAKAKPEIKEVGEGEQEEDSFFPVAYVFSSNQVTPISNPKNQTNEN